MANKCTIVYITEKAKQKVNFSLEALLYVDLNPCEICTSYSEIWMSPSYIKLLISTTFLLV